MHTITPSHARPCGVRFAVLLCSLLALFAATSARAMNLDAYDLDSLVYMSSDIVEATLVREYKEQDLDLREIKVTAVHKGAFTPGQSVAVAALDFYKTPDIKMNLNTEPLQNGDTCIFFLVRAKAQMLWNIPDDAVIYWTVPSGLKLVIDNKIASFFQMSNPGPYVAQLPEVYPAVKFPTTEEYRAQIHDSMKKIDALSTLLTQPATPADAPKLMELLRERTQAQNRWQHDALAEAACTQLAKLHDPAILLEAISLNLPSPCESNLAIGLGTPAGRDALLARIGDNTKPLEERVLDARMLMYTGAIYHSEISENGATVIGEPQDDNAEYLTRIARLAVQNQQHEELCLILLQNLGASFNFISQMDIAAINADMQSALSVVKTLYDATKSEQVKLQVELATSNASREAYDQLDSPCGPVLSILTLPNRGNAKQNVMIQYEIHLLAKTDGALSVVFANQETGKTWAVPTEIPLQNIGGSRPVTLPDDLPKGRYRVYLQCTRGEEVISVGHYAETEL